jgi:hypothetical protein
MYTWGGTAPGDTYTGGGNGGGGGGAMYTTCADAIEGKARTVKARRRKGRIMRGDESSRRAMLEIVSLR